MSKRGKRIENVSGGGDLSDAKRDARGRLLPGHKGGPGRPPKPPGQNRLDPTLVLRQYLYDQGSPETVESRLGAAIDALLVLVIDHGDTEAAKIVLPYLLHKMPDAAVTQAMQITLEQDRTQVAEDRESGPRPPKDGDIGRYLGTLVRVATDAGIKADETAIPKPAIKVEPAGPRSAIDDMLE